jgi:predicted DNA-binding transcriptional regulator AlpA
MEALITKELYMTQQATSINSALREADQLPNSAQIRLPTLTGLLGISNATVWRMVKAGKIKAYKLTERTTTFNMGEVRELINAQKVEG